MAFDSDTPAVAHRARARLGREFTPVTTGPGAGFKQRPGGGALPIVDPAAAAADSDSESQPPDLALT